MQTDDPMNPGKRVAVISKAAESLETRRWSTIDLVLDQFGFPTLEEWQGSKHDYVIAMLRDGDDDEALTALGAYIEPGDVRVTAPQPAAADDDPLSPWTTGGFRLFISHTNSEKGNVTSLAKALAAHSIEAFVAHEAIRPTAQWQAVIESALENCDGLLAWLRPAFKESDWCDQELGFAIARKVLVIPARFGQDPYGFIGKYQAVPVRAKLPLTELAQDIFEICLSHDASSDSMARALVWRFANSDSFNSARANLSYLRRITTQAWTSELQDIVRKAAQDNPQINNLWVGSLSGPSAVESILKAAAERPSTTTNSR
jgi:hypothetical protein